MRWDEMRCDEEDIRDKCVWKAWETKVEEIKYTTQLVKVRGKVRRESRSQDKRWDKKWKKESEVSVKL